LFIVDLFCDEYKATIISTTGKTQICPRTFSKKFLSDNSGFFSSTLSEQRGKGKNSPFRPRQTPSAKIGHVGVYFAKIGCKIEGGFTDILGLPSKVSCAWSEWPILTGLCLGSFNKFRSQKRKWLESILPWRSHLFSSLILTLL
jgi:hypothetical protein